MNLKTRIGLGIFSAGLKVARFGSSLAGIQPSQPTSYTAIHNVVDGPFTQMDLGYEWDGPQEAEAYLVVKLEHNGKVEDVEWYFLTLDDAYDMVKHFKGSIEPIVIEGISNG